MLVGAELHHQPAVAFGQQAEVLADGTAFLLHVVVQPIVDALQRRGLELVQFDHVIGGLVDVGIAEHQDHAFGASIDQLALGFEHRDQRPFAADQRARDVEAAVLAGNELIEVVAGDAARNGRIVLAG